MNEMIQFLIRHGYTVLFFWILFEQLGLPIPAAPLLIAAGTLAGIGQLNLALVFGVSVVGSFEQLDRNHYKIPRNRDIVLYCT